MAGKVTARHVGRPSKNGAVSLTPVPPMKSNQTQCSRLMLGLTSLDIGQSFAQIKTSIAHVKHQLEEFTVQEMQFMTMCK